MIEVKVGTIENIFLNIIDSYDWDDIIDDTMKFKQWIETEFNCKITYRLGVPWFAETITFDSEEDYFLFLMRWP